MREIQRRKKERARIHKENEEKAKRGRAIKEIFGRAKSEEKLNEEPKELVGIKGKENERDLFTNFFLPNSLFL